MHSGSPKSFPVWEVWREVWISSPWVSRDWWGEESTEFPLWLVLIIWPGWLQSLPPQLAVGLIGQVGHMVQQHLHHGLQQGFHLNSGHLTSRLVQVSASECKKVVREFGETIAELNAKDESNEVLTMLENKVRQSFVDQSLEFRCRWQASSPRFLA